LQNITALIRRHSKIFFDWISRIHATTFQEKQTLIMATSPGPRGGSSVLESRKNLPFQGANVKGSFSLPSFNDNFDTKNGITNKELTNSY
jgi:NAD(P)H-dependent FMN reductase